MKGFDEPASREATLKSQEPGNQRQTSYNETLRLDDRWIPCLQSRALVKECLLKIKTVMRAVAGTEWYGFTILGILMAALSFLMDLTVTKLITVHQWLFRKLAGHMLLQFLCWTLYPVSLCAVSASFSHNICPSTTGSGLPEVRAMLAGVDMPHYRSLTNLFVKFLGLTCTLAAGSTVFLGKVGPFVHLSTMVGGYLRNLCTLIQGNNNKGNVGGEMLVVAAAVGVASCFGAPISGVLFSVEVMSSHFSLKDYCPCFFSAACGTLAFRLLSVWSGNQATLEPLFKTNFPEALPFYPQEILLFALLGVCCGLVSCLYLFLHRWILRFSKTNKILIQMLTTEKALYSAAVAFLLASLTFPHFAGQYLASMLGMLVLACTLPVPAGYFMPVFIYGAAIGRLLGEGVAYVSSTIEDSAAGGASVNPGGYALAGAAAFSGAVTHTLSPALLAIEMTGQFTHAVPVLLATLLANAVARSRSQPSFYDAISISKRLPHLPSLLKASPQLSSTPIGEFLGALGPVLERSAGIMEVQQIINSSTQQQIPVVNSLDSWIPLGSVSRSDLLAFLHQKKDKDMEERMEHTCCIHPNTVQISTSNTIQEVHGLLSLLSTDTLFVTHKGKLAALVTWPEMKRILEDVAREV